MNDTQRKQIISLRAAGLSYSKVAAVINLSTNTVKSFCNRNGLGGVASEKNPELNDAKVCQYCGELVVQTPGRKEKKFCSDHCRNMWWNSHLDLVDRRANYEYTCPACGKAFTVYGNSNRKYCSYECYVKARWRHA